jgi:protein involved in polysaccharide export with SLBB domain
MKPERHSVADYRAIRLLALMLFAIGWLTAAGIALGQAGAPLIDPDATPATRITPHCVLTVVVSDEPDLSGAFAVDAEGKIHFAIADADGDNKTTWTVTVMGKTADEAREAILDSLKTYLREPDVKVYLTKVARLTVDIVGPAKLTGKLELPIGAHLSDAMARCGYLANADIANVRILRKQPIDGKPQTKTIAVDFAAFARGESDTDPTLDEGDKIVLPLIPEHVVPKLVRVDGEVARQASIPISRGMTVRDALQRAGGLKETADRDRIRLVRADGRIIELRADAIDANEPTQNLMIATGDLLIVERADRSLRWSAMGEVLHPGTFPYNPKEPLTVLRALQKVGGPTRNADLKKGLLRKGFFLNPAHTVDIYFDLTQIVKGKQQDWAVEAGDAMILQPKPRKPNLLQELLPIALRFLPLF